MQKLHEKETKMIPSTGAILPDGRIIELIYEPAERKTAFAVGSNGDVQYMEKVEVGTGEVLVPTSPRNNLVQHQVVALPSAATEFGTTTALVEDIRAYLHCYVDLSPDFEIVAAHYVLLTWVYDAFNEIPYLRFQGDYGTGKSRALLILGYICYKGIFASGASTVSPIFHILDAFRGTLILDEADFRFSDEKAELSKILNNGNVRGFPVLRTTVNRDKEFDPRAFQVFGPKLVGMRKSYEDKALESRFLTEHMGTRGLREGIPINLPDCQQEEALHLRNKLLMYRVRNRASVRMAAERVADLSEARLRQILAPLTAICSNDVALTALRSLATKSNEDIRLERSESTEGQLFGTMIELFRDAGTQSVPVAKIADRFRRLHGAEYQRPITNRWIGSVLRDRLHLQTYKSHGVYVVPWVGDVRFADLCRRYGFEPWRMSSQPELSTPSV